MARLQRIAAMVVITVVLLTSLVGTAAAAAPGYVVQPGDTLFRISIRFGVSMDAIRAANGFTGDRIYSGQNLIIPDGSAPANPPPADSGNTAGNVIHVVQAGETLFTIGLKYGLVWTRIQAANNLAGTIVYAGQRLVIPLNGEPTAPPTNSDTPGAPPDGGSQTPPPVPSTGGTVHTVVRGETLHKIGLLYGVPWPAIQQANGLANTTIWVGQQLVIPAGSGVTAPPASDPPPGGSFEGRYFVVDLSEQRVYAYEGSTLVRTTLVSTGTSATPTVVGTFSVYLRFESTRMRGPGYDLPNVPYTMYFFKGYGLHGTYWHNNFGTPMSHGCVNMPTPEAEWAYNWSTYGTPVIVQY